MIRKEILSNLTTKEKYDDDKYYLFIYHKKCEKLKIVTVFKRRFKIFIKLKKVYLKKISIFDRIPKKIEARIPRNLVKKLPEFFDPMILWDMGDRNDKIPKVEITKTN